MSDGQLQETAGNDGATKRNRKPSIRANDEEERQRERKRALDRKAQRASREKTRAHIAHLENMVRILSGSSGSSSTGELLEEMNRLHGEIDRLRKIIENIKSVLGVEFLEPEAPRCVKYLTIYGTRLIDSDNGHNPLITRTQLIKSQLHRAHT